MACNCIGGNPCPCQRGPLPIINLAGVDTRLSTDYNLRLQEENKRLEKVAEFRLREIKRLRKKLRTATVI